MTRSSSCRRPATCSTEHSRPRSSVHPQRRRLRRDPCGGRHRVHWEWYGGLVGAYFLGHPEPADGLIDIEDADDHSTLGLPERWQRFDEWYDFKPINFEQTGNLDYSPRGQVHVLATLDESTTPARPPAPPIIRSPGASASTAAAPGTRRSDTPRRPTSNRSSCATSWAASRSPPARRHPRHAAARAGTARTRRTRTAISTTTTTAAATTSAADGDRHGQVGRRAHTAPPPMMVSGGRSRRSSRGGRDHVQVAVGSRLDVGDDPEIAADEQALALGDVVLGVVVGHAVVQPRIVEHEGCGACQLETEQVAALRSGVAPPTNRSPANSWPEARHHRRSRCRPAAPPTSRELGVAVVRDRQRGQQRAWPPPVSLAMFVGGQRSCCSDAGRTCVSIS